MILGINVQKEWHVNGKLHREGDKPACISLVDVDDILLFSRTHNNLVAVNARHMATDVVNVRRIYYKWYQFGKLHREEDKPAKVNGVYDVDMPGLGEIGLIEKEVALVCAFRQFWYQNDDLHRDGDLPAIQSEFGRWWFSRGEIHRDGNLPAIERADGTREWYVRGKRRAVVWADTYA